MYKNVRPEIQLESCPIKIRPQVTTTMIVQHRSLLNTTENIYWHVWGVLLCVLTKYFRMADIMIAQKLVNYSSVQIPLITVSASVFFMRNSFKKTPTLSHLMMTAGKTHNSFPTISSVKCMPCDFECIFFLICTHRCMNTHSDSHIFYIIIKSPIQSLTFL